MPWPTFRDWLFTCKAFLAAIVALYIAMSLGLERPYWAMASAYIAIQPLAGATRSKAIYRGVGTVVGASVAVALVPPLSNAPVLLSLALALWTGICLYFALLDRGPSSYGFMLAGYTAGIIGFPSVAAPEAIFDTALTRVEEIGLGIFIATLVSQVIVPRPVNVALDRQIANWLGNARRWVFEAMDGTADNEAWTRRLAADFVEIDTLAGNLGYGAAAWQTQQFGWLRERMIMMLPGLASMTDRMQALRNEDGALPPTVQSLVDELRGWIDTPLAPAEDILSHIAAAQQTVATASDWHSLMLSGLLYRMYDLVQVVHDCAILRRGLTGLAPTPVDLWFAPEGTASQVWHRDSGMALLSAFAAFVAVLAACAIWIATAWPEGYVAAELVAVACSFFATLDDPVPAIMSFLTWSIVAVVVDGILLFGALPAATTFGSLVLVLAPAYLIAGLLVSMPATAGIGRALTANGATLLALDSSYSADFPTFVNSSLAFVLGLLLAAILTRLIRSVGAAFSANRLLRVIWRELAVAAEQRGNRDRGRYLGLMLDRLALVAPRLAGQRNEAAASAVEALADIRIGLNIIDLRRSRHELTDAERVPIDAMLDALAVDYRARAGATSEARNTGRLLGAVDRALQAVVVAPANKGRMDALLGLIGIRRGLFPDAAGFVMPRS